MKKIKPQAKNIPASDKRDHPTLLEFMAGLNIEGAKVCGVEMSSPATVKAYPLPAWGQKIYGQFRKTIMRPILKLRPHAKTDCQDFGKIIGVLNRQITFLQTEVWEIAMREGWDKISDEDWERIQPRAQLRDFLLKKLNRPLVENETLEGVTLEIIEQEIARLEKLRNTAYRFISNRSVKEQALFYKGLAQGYELFMNSAGELCGNRGRTEIYMELLSSSQEIEKMRRMLPAKNDSDLYDHLKPWYRFPNGREAGKIWLRDVCDDISLHMTGKRGRPYGCKPAPEF